MEVDYVCRRQARMTRPHVNLIKSFIHKLFSGRSQFIVKQLTSVLWEANCLFNCSEHQTLDSYVYILLKHSCVALTSFVVVLDFSWCFVVTCMFYGNLHITWLPWLSSGDLTVWGHLGTEYAFKCMTSWEAKELFVIRHTAQFTHRDVPQFNSLFSGETWLPRFPLISLTPPLWIIITGVLKTRCPSRCPTNSDKVLKETHSWCHQLSMGFAC